MAKVIGINKKSAPADTSLFLSETARKLVQARKQAKRVPLTTDKVIDVTGLKNLSATDAIEAVDTIKKLATLLFEMYCQRERICIDNQQVVCLNKQNKAA